MLMKYGTELGLRYPLIAVLPLAAPVPERLRKGAGTTGWEYWKL